MFTKRIIRSAQGFSHIRSHKTAPKQTMLPRLEEVLGEICAGIFLGTAMAVMDRFILGKKPQVAPEEPQSSPKP